jgi:hypothetical protein
MSYCFADAAELASSASGKGAALIGYESRTVKAKLDDWVTLSIKEPSATA